ncbi:MAG: 4-hydroxythreonine-4-phosphate dehydrogenase PdxA [Paludibacteraceae bacterium]|nr:4-hydroxythreonine-4-phosphate dehydrogenase PdxA [Paludibacteraceae bacterium]
MEKNLIKIGITLGDINGIGPEVTLKALSEPHLLDICTPVIYGSSKVIGFYKKALGMEHPLITYVKNASEAVPHRISLVNCQPEEVKVEVGRATQEGGQMAYSALRAAAEDWKAGYLDSVVTAPINKATIQSDEFHFHGHTEFFGELCGAMPLMLLVSDRLRVALVTNHTPIHEVAQSITKELIVEKLEILNNALMTDFAVIRPRIAVLALNPHAGDNGLLGSEENNIIIPAIQEATEKGICCVGPLAADGFFGAGNYAKYDAVLAMYHDQGLAPFKAIAMDDGVNVTCGLDIVRTAPAHGTAYSLAAQNVASHSSMLHAIYQAIDIIRQRALEEKLHENPLQVSPDELPHKKQTAE